MKNAVALIAVAGIASVASAQNFSLSLVPSATSVAQSGSFTMSVYGDADMGTHMLGGSFSLSSDSALVSNMSWANAAWSAFNTDGGYAGNGNYNAVIFGQLIIPGVPPFDQPAPGSELTGLIGTFTVTVGADAGDIDFGLNAEDPFSLQTIDINTGGLFDNSQGQISLGSARVTVTPAPSALALLGLGGIAAGRRRR